LAYIDWNIWTAYNIYLIKEVGMKPGNSRLPPGILLALVCASLMLAVFPRPALAMTQEAGVPQVTTPAAFDCTYTVRPGDTLFRIAVRFGVSPFTLAAVNGLRNINLIFVGMVLRVPCGGLPPPTPPPGPNICNIHIVQRGEWLNLIAARFGVSWQSIAALNRLANPSLLFPGQRLLIPCTSGTPARTISTNQPITGQAICSPVSVSGSVTISPFEATLRGRVYNDQGIVVGESAIHVNAQMGQPGTFSGQINFDTSRVKSGTQGRVEVADISPRDGSVLASSSVLITFSCGQ
jgi:LysM repeat protein